MKTLKSYRFDDATIETIEELRNTLHLASGSDLLRKAVSVLKMISDNQSKGGSVVIKLKKSEKEIVLS